MNGVEKGGLALIRHVNAVRGEARRRDNRPHRGPAGRDKVPRGLRGPRGRLDHRGTQGPRAARSDEARARVQGRRREGVVLARLLGPVDGAPAVRARQLRQTRRREGSPGTVRLKLYKGGLRVVGRSSTNSLYKVTLSTYQKGSTFDQSSAVGFIELWGLQSRIAAKMASGGQERKKCRTY